MTQPRVPIVIIGFMGCGKTEVARKLADRLTTKVADLDEVITAREGKTPARLIVDAGEKSFRAAETAALQSVLEAAEVEILSLGGGAWIEAKNREIVRQFGGFSVFLDVPFAVCWERIQTSGDDRPLGKTMEQAASLFESRRHVYQLADLRIESLSHETSDDLTSRLEKAVREILRA